MIYKSLYLEEDKKIFLISKMGFDGDPEKFAGRMWDKTKMVKEDTGEEYEFVIINRNTFNSIPWNRKTIYDLNANLDYLNPKDSEDAMENLSSMLGEELKKKMENLQNSQGYTSHVFPPIQETYNNFQNIMDLLLFEEDQYDEIAITESILHLNKSTDSYFINKMKELINMYGKAPNDATKRAAIYQILMLSFVQLAKRS